MRSILLTLPALVLLAPTRGSTQPVDSFRNLALRINLGDELRIEDRSAARSAGVVTGLTPDAITIAGSAGERRFTRAEVREVALRRRAHRIGVMVGAAAGAGLGAAAACFGDERRECADGAIILGATGAAVGFAIGSLVPRTAIVYRQPSGMPPPDAPAPTPGPFDDLALRVNLDDRLRVEDHAGATFTGRLTHLAGDEMTIDTAAGERRFTSAAVSKVRIRRHALRNGALIGAGGFAVLALAAPACRSNPNCTPLPAALVGAGVGLAVASVVPVMTTVYRGQQMRASMAPQFSRGTVAVRASVRW
jgi:hypothetical protein